MTAASTALPTSDTTPGQVTRVVAQVGTVVMVLVAVMMIVKLEVIMIVISTA